MVRRTGSGIRTIHGSNESITAACVCFDIAGMLRRVTQRRPQSFNACIQAVIEIDERLSRPQSVPQHFTGNQLPGPLQEHLEDRERLTFQADAHSVFAQFSRDGAEFVNAETNDTRPLRNGHPALVRCAWKYIHARPEFETPVTPLRNLFTLRDFCYHLEITQQALTVSAAWGMVHLTNSNGES